MCVHVHVRMHTEHLFLTRHLCAILCNVTTDIFVSRKVWILTIRGFVAQTRDLRSAQQIRGSRRQSSDSI